MGDDLNIIVPPVEEEESLDETGLALVRLLESCQARIDQMATTIGEQNARIIILEERLGELGAREYAPLGHTHEGFADTGHSHDGYAPTDHTHQTEREERKPDKRPENQHPYFRKVGE